MSLSQHIFRHLLCLVPGTPVKS